MTKAVAAGKKEVGHIVLANGGRLENGSAIESEENDSELIWVAEGESKRSQQLQRTNSSVLAQQETRRYAFERDENSRLLDELASKEDYHVGQRSQLGRRDVI